MKKSGSKSVRNQERRHEVRHDATTLPHLSAHLVKGPAVRLLDISRRGAMVESDTPLRPGRSVSLRFATPDAELILTGCVVRTTVSALTEAHLKYRTGLSFGDDNTLCARLVERKSSDEAAAPSVGAEQASTAAADGDQILTLVTSVEQSADELRDMLMVNEW
jgi:PilZ domain